MIKVGQHSENQKRMDKKNIAPNKAEADDMLPEYDLRGKKGVRGKYADIIKNGYTVHVKNEDGTVTITRYPPSDAKRKKLKR